MADQSAAPSKESDDSEEVRKLRRNYARNQAYAKQDEYTTKLNPQSEARFRAWVAANKVPFNPSSAINDYDMRGFWLALQSKDPAAVSAINPYDKQTHYPDRWKTPYHETFSAESQWAKPGAPTWNKEDQLVMPSGVIIFDSRKTSAPPQTVAIQPPPAVAPVPVQPATQEPDLNAPR